MKAVVIGAGLAGLATALRLRAAGWEVEVFEAGATPGGKLNTLRDGEFCFDTGPSLITMPHVFAELYTAAGEWLQEHVSLIRVDPNCEYRFADGARVVCPSGTDAWREVIRGIEPKDVEGFDELTKLGRKLYELSNRTFFQRSPMEPPRLADLTALRYLPGPRGWGKYAATVDHYLRSPYLRQIYNRYPTYVGSSPYLCPATLLIIPFLEREFGAWYFRGGLYKLVESLVQLLCARGVSIHCNTRVAAIEREGARVAGVRLEDGRQVKAHVVVMNGDVATMPELMGGSKPGKREELSMSGFVLLAGLRERPAGLSHHTVLFSSDYEKEFDDIVAQRRFPEEPTVYISAPGANDHSLAPSGGEALFIMANAPSHCACEGALERVMGVLDRNGLSVGYDDLSAIYDPARFEKQFRAPGGAIYGSHSNDWKHAFLRPANRSPEVRGLYFAGGSSHPGGGTPTVLMSAKIVAEMIEADARA